MTPLDVPTGSGQTLTAECQRQIANSQMLVANCQLLNFVAAGPVSRILYAAEAA
jgi:hypothetical protein